MRSSVFGMRAGALASEIGSDSEGSSRWAGRKAFAVGNSRTARTEADAAVWRQLRKE